MTKRKWKNLFVQTIPTKLKRNTFYICLKYNVVVHLCACGCGNKVITPIDKNHGWKFEYDGDNITLYPSIGNFSYPCKSHYYVQNGKIKWIKNDGSHDFISFIKSFANKPSKN